MNSDPSLLPMRSINRRRLLVAPLLSLAAGCVSASRAEPFGEVVFVRHGETVANVSGRYTSATVNRLTENGVRKASEVAALLSKETFDEIIVSPAPRCVETAHHLLKRVGLRAAVWPELEEVSTSTLRDKSKGGKPELGGPIQLPPQLATWVRFDRKADRSHLRSDSEAAALVQVEWAARRLHQRARQGGKILVFGHSLIGSRIIEVLLGAKPEGRFVLENAAINRLRVDKEGRVKLMMQNNRPTQG